MDINNVTINTFENGAYDIQTYVECDSKDILRIEFFQGKNSATLFPSTNIYGMFIVDL